MGKRIRSKERVLLGSLIPGRGSLPQPKDVDLGKGLNPWGLQRKLKPNDTTDLVREEITMLRYVIDNQPVKLWTLLNRVARLAGPHKYQSRSQRQKLIPLFSRLCREGKLFRHRTTETVRLGPRGHNLTFDDISDIPEDLCQPLRDVPGMDSVT